MKKKYGDGSHHAALRLWSWNIAQRSGPWKVIADDALVDAVLLQEATPPLADVPLGDLIVTPAATDDWVTAGSVRKYRTAIAWRSTRIRATPRTLGCMGDGGGALCISRPGTVTALDVTLPDGTVTLVSAYSYWETPHTGKRPIYADASAHRIISDISALIDSGNHRIVVAGDFNLYHGYGDRGSEYWKARYATVFSRFEALGFAFLGPQAGNNQRQATPCPPEVPVGSKNVPTFHTNRQKPETAAHQLDFVFASTSIAQRVDVRAINGVNEWGPSDHCRIEIVINRL